MKAYQAYVEWEEYNERYDCGKKVSQLYVNKSDADKALDELKLWADKISGSFDSETEIKECGVSEVDILDSFTPWSMFNKEDVYLKKPSSYNIPYQGVIDTLKDVFQKGEWINRLTFTIELDDEPVEIEMEIYYGDLRLRDNTSRELGKIYHKNLINFLERKLNKLFGRFWLASLSHLRMKYEAKWRMAGCCTDMMEVEMGEEHFDKLCEDFEVFCNENGLDEWKERQVIIENVDRLRCTLGVNLDKYWY